MNIFALDCHKPEFNLCILYNNIRFFYLSSRKSEYIYNVFKKIMSVYDIDFNKFDMFLGLKGPGSFTGLRAGLSFLEGLCLGNTKKIALIPTFRVYKEYLDIKNLKGYTIALSAGFSDVFVYDGINGYKIVNKNDLKEGKILTNINLSYIMVNIALQENLKMGDLELDYGKAPAINLKRNNK